MGNAKWVHMMFFVGALPLAYVCVQFVDWVWGLFAQPKELATVIAGVGLAAVTAFLAWRNENTFGKASDIVNELTKVTWPTRKETRAATIVVIITTIISSLFLGLFDVVWSWVTGVIYS